MKLLLTTITALCLTAVGGDREEGLKLYRAGRYAEAQAAFARALQAEPDSAELQWNLALAAWRAGDLVTAETAAEKYAAGSDEAAEDRHRGMLGAVRYAEAEQLERQADAAASLPTAAPGADEEPPADPAPLLEKAVQKALQARNHFVRAIRANPTAEHVRNGERAVRKLEELKQKLEELMQQRQTEPQQQGEDGEEQGEEGQDGEQQPGDPEQGEPEEGGERERDPSSEQQQGGEPQGDPAQAPPSGEGEAPEPPEPQPAEGEPEPEGEQQGEAAPPPEQPPAAGEAGAEPEPAAEAGEPEEKMGLPEPDQGKPRADAPGEGGQDQELSPEQAKRLLDRLKAMEQQMKQARARARAGRKPVERDW